METWRKNLYIVWFTQLLSLIGFGFGLPFLPYYIQQLGITDPEKLKLWSGLLASAPAVSMAITAPLWGILADKYGKKLMLVRAMLGGTLVMAGLSLSSSATAVLILRILQGAFSGTVTSSAALVASGTPDNRMSYALGFLSSSTFIGYSLGPAAGGLIAEFSGYRLSFLKGSFSLFLGMLLVVIFIKEPEVSASANDPAPEPAGLIKKKQSFMTPVLWMLFGFIFLVRFSRTITTPFIPLLVQEYRGTIDGSSGITGLISGGIGLMSALSGLTLARLGDRVSRTGLLSVLLLPGTVLSALLFRTTGLVSFSVLVMLTYFFIGGVEPLVMSLTAERVGSGKRGLLFGIQTMVGSFAWFLSPLAGSWISIRFSIKAVFAGFSLLLACTLLYSILLRPQVNKEAAVRRL